MSLYWRITNFSKGSNGGHKYIGYLKNTPSSSVAVTGHLASPSDRMEITLLSDHTADQMFEVDYFGRTEIIPVPEKSSMKGISKPSDRKFTVQDGFTFTWRCTSKL